jgi:hypothetical protein
MFLAIMQAFRSSTIRWPLHQTHGRFEWLWINTC